MSLTDKYHALEKIVKIEETQRCRCGYMYEITFNLYGKKKTFYFDMNHRFSIKDGSVIFEKNKKPTDGSDWNYNKEPFSTAVISVMPAYNHATEIKEMRELLQTAYLEHEKKWQSNET